MFACCSSRSWQTVALFQNLLVASVCKSLNSCEGSDHPSLQSLGIYRTGLLWSFHMAVLPGGARNAQYWPHRYEKNRLARDAVLQGCGSACQQRWISIQSKQLFYRTCCRLYSRERGAEASSIQPPDSNRSHSHAHLRLFFKTRTTESLILATVAGPTEGFSFSKRLS